MKKLPLAKRVQVLSMLCEESSMRSINTVFGLLVDAGKACAAHHDATVRGMRLKRIQADEIWSFCYAKAKNVPTAKTAPDDAGDVGGCDGCLERLWPALLTNLVWSLLPFWVEMRRQPPSHTCPAQHFLRSLKRLVLAGHSLADGRHLAIQ